MSVYVVPCIILVMLHAFYLQEMEWSYTDNVSTFVQTHAHNVHHVNFQEDNHIMVVSWEEQIEIHFNTNPLITKLN